MAEAIVRQSFYDWMSHVAAKDSIPDAITETIVETSPIEEIIMEASAETHSVENGKLMQDFSSSESYNGAIYENYSWSQNITEVDIHIKVPPDVTAKNLLVNILPNEICVKIKNTNVTLLEGKLCNKCKHIDAVWSLDKCKLEIHLEKASEMWWDCLVHGEPKLDITQIDCSRPYEDLSEEAQAKIQELTWNQERKRLGLPTSEEIQMQEKLKKAWHAEGSPFKGPFDPSTVIFEH